VLLLHFVVLQQLLQLFALFLNLILLHALQSEAAVVNQAVLLHFTRFRSLLVREIGNWRKFALFPQFFEFFPNFLPTLLKQRIELKIIWIPERLTS